MTQANVNINTDFQAEEDKTDFGNDEEQRGATMPYFKLPEAEREKYQNITPPPTKPMTAKPATAGLLM